MRVEDVIEEITQRCRKYGAQEIILFGSRAKGTATERSDGVRSGFTRYL